ncbi:MAG: GNAT family N-acetyltransferase [Planctomycetes bacterium]|nr:GNAT family N-acetyltransferase [Planctomycetota bacterium]
MKRPRFRPWVATQALLDRLPWRLRDPAAAEAGGPSATSPSATSAPTDEASERALHGAIARAVIAALASQRVARVELESYDGPWPAPDFAAPEFAPLRLETRERLEFLLDLRGDVETRFAAIKSSHRRKVRDAEKAGVTVAEESGATALSLLHELQSSTKERREGRGETMALPEAEQYERLQRCFVGAGSGRLFVGRKEGQAMSAILCGVEGPRAYYLMGGTSAAGFECNAATLVLWRASVLLAQGGVVELNLGGVPREAETAGHAEHGLWRFKEGFAPRRVECRSAIWQRGNGR